MSDVIKKLEEKFNISNLREAIIGGTMISLDPSVGAESSNWNIPIILDLKQRLNLYHELADMEKEQENPFDYMGLSTIWNVGFVTANEKLTTPDFFGGQSSKYLKSRKLKTVDQLFARRSDSSTQAFFGCFKFNGATNPITSFGSGAEFDEQKRYGLICDRWITHPQTIKYVASIKGSSSKSRDYLYLIGGDHIDFFDPTWSINKICELKKEIHTLSKQFSASKTIPSDIKNIYKTLTEANQLWIPFNAEKHQDFILSHPYVILGLKQRMLMRMLGSVFDYYNYLLHAYKHLKLPHVYEVTSDNLGKPVKIEELLKKYERVYKFCKNIVLLDE